MIKKIFSLWMLPVAVLSSAAPLSLANDATIAKYDEASVEFIPVESHETESLASSHLFPIGQMLVNRETNEGIVLACVRFHESQDCDRFRFAKFSDSENLKSYRWASSPFTLSLRFSDSSPQKQRRMLRKWIRKTLSAPRISQKNQMILVGLTVGVTLAVSAVMTSPNLAESGPSAALDWIRKGAVGLIPLLASANVFAPLVAGSAGAVVGRKTENSGEMRENYLIRKTFIRDRVFSRILDRLHSGVAFSWGTKWVSALD